MEIARNLWRRKLRTILTVSGIVMGIFCPDHHGFARRAFQHAARMGEVDTDTALALLGLMRRINAERGVTFVIVTHDLELAARTDRVIRLRDGHLLSDEHTAVAGAARPAVAVGAA
ncbi:MAG: hypothetical protein JOZ75_14090 [Candidatus Dormibacteraeota bacterium]|nr:hypothetical protein [Candidatus Dormibacteraeota bacterium]